ncbi:hypothetical protein Tco_0856715 [Tanacetum coccineum]|uniref:Uncharacterized protein n=1 Tax=Tanacetum coccineum TaxID=301880 RepID=A0ABQ5B776_9ASTR
MPQTLIPLRPNLGVLQMVLQIGIKSQDSEHFTVTYTSVSILVEDDSDIGSPGINGPPIMPEDPYAYIMAAYQVPPSLDYIPGPEVPPSPDYIPSPEEPQGLRILPAEEQPLPAAASPTADSPGYVPESDPEEEPEEDDEDPEEDPTDYPADREDDDDDDEDEDEDEEEEEEHPSPADSVLLVHRMTARISIRDEPSISLPPREEVERLLALTTPPPSPLTPLSSPLPHIPSPPLPASPPPNSPTHIEIPESCLPLRKRVRFASPTPSHEVGESSAAGAARQDGPAIAREDPYSVARGDLYGFVDMVDVAPGHPMSRELDYGITDTWDDMRLPSSDHRRQRVFSELLALDYKRQVQLTNTLRLLKGLHTQMVEFQRQHGPAKGPAQPDAPGEAGSSS